MALSDYRDQVIKFRKLRMAQDDTEVTAKSVMRHRGKERTSIDYSVEKTPGGGKSTISRSEA